MGTSLGGMGLMTIGFITLGIGLGMAPHGDPAGAGFFRVGHMGHVSGHSMMGTLATIDAGLKALSVPHGSGALDAAAEVMAGVGR